VTKFLLSALTASFLFPPQTFAALKDQSFFRLEYGIETKDQITLEKMNQTVWRAEFIDRGRMQRDRSLKRAFPKEVAQKQIAQFDSLIRQFGGHLIENPKEGSCRFTLLVTWGKSEKKSSSKKYCPEALTRNESLRLGAWIKSTTDLFQF